MDLSKLSNGDKVIAGSGIALLIFSFLPWFTFDAGPFGTYKESGWDYFFTGIVPVILGLVMIGYVAAAKLGDVDMPDTPVEPVQAMLGLGIAAAVLVILRLIIGGDDQGTDALDRSYGLFLAVLAAIGLAAGAFLNFKEEGGTIPGSGSSGSSGDSATPF